MSEDSTSPTHACPGCGEQIKLRARKCRHCGDFLDPKLKQRRRKERQRELRPGGEPTRLRKVWRVGCAVVFPLLCFGLSEGGATSELLPEWNSGSGWVWAKLLYAPEVQRWTYPFVAWAMVAYVAYGLGHRNGWIEAGLLGGVVLSSLYSLLFLPMTPLAFVGIVVYGIGLLGFMPFVACFIYTAAYVRYRREPAAVASDPEESESEAASAQAHSISASEDAQAEEPTEEDREPLPLASASAAAGAGAAGFSWAPRAVWVASWLGATGGALYTLNDLHAALATTPPPRCYLATLAARGDPRFTQATPIRFSDGRVRPVSRQLRVFKVAELTLQATAPALHRTLRWLYDRTGQPFAARMGRRHATTIYVVLLPAQILTELCLGALFRGSRALIDATYAEPR